MKNAKALQYYKQALQVNVQHWPSMYNMAALYEKQGRIKATLKWLKRVTEANPDFHPTYGALAKTLLKINSTNKALGAIQKGYELVLKSHSYSNLHSTIWEKYNIATKVKPAGIPIDESEGNWHLYVKALCLKQLERYPEATQAYLEHKNKSQQWEQKELWTDVFGILSLPAISNRRMIMNTLENMLDHMKMHESQNAPVVKSLQDRFFDKKTN